jgi:hypothetical protein
MWPLVLSVFELLGVFGMWQAGRGRWWGWLVVMVHSWPWAVYAIVSDQPGFLFMFVMWQIVNGWNCWSWFHRPRTL